MRALVDTSALFALLDERDENHERATEILASLGPGDLVTTNYLVVESIALIHRRLGAGATMQLVDGLLAGIAQVWIDEPTHRAALAAFRLRQGGPSLVDQTSFLVMRQLALTETFAFDRDFEAEGFRTLRAAAPGRRHELSERRVAYGSAAVELVSVAEIARRSGRPISTIQSWRRRHASFPRPIADLAAGPVWTWADVGPWIASRPRQSARAERVPVEGRPSA